MMSRATTRSSRYALVILPVLVLGWGAVQQPTLAGIAVVGDVTPTYDGSDPWVLASDLILGAGADASMTISGGSEVISPDARVAAGIGTTASVQVTGVGSRWETDLFLGDRGNGTLTVSDGASLAAGEVFVGSEAGSVGNLILTGPGTTWLGTASGSYYPLDGLTADQYGASGTSIFASIGRHGTGNVTISNGAQVLSDGGNLYLGYWQDGVGNLTVTGAGSAWENTGDIYVGFSGTGTLVISDGGAMTSGGVANIGNWRFGNSSGSATVTDPGSLWRIDGGLYVGGYGDGELLISNGGRVESEWAHVSDLATVTGSGSLWQIDRYLVVGHGYGDNAGLNIEAGGQVTDANAYVGWKPDGYGTVQVRGPGSLWTNSAELHVGDAGNGTVYIEEGGRVTSRTGVIGTEATGDGIVFVTGPDSVWENLPDPNSGLGGDLYVGLLGHGVLTIGSGGRVVSETASLGYDITGSGEAIVNGPGSLWENHAALEVGGAGGGHLWISNGGTVTTADAIVATDAGSTGVVTVEGPDSVLDVEHDLVLGSRGEASMSVSGGGWVSAQQTFVAAEAGSTAVVNVTGPGSLWESIQSLYIGQSGEATLNVTNGGVVSVERGVSPFLIIIDPPLEESIMAVEPGSVGHAVITGAGSLWHNGGNLVIAKRGTADVLVADGGRLDAGRIDLGRYPGAVGSLVVTGSGSVCESLDGLFVGDNGTATVTISEGGLVSGPGATVGAGVGGVGIVTVTDPGSTWHLDGVLYVGGVGDGELLVAAGGRVESGYGYVFDVASVTDPGSVWQTFHALYIGEDEADATREAVLDIRNGGLVDGNNVIIRATGTVMGDGTLKANEVVNYGTISPGASIGTLTIDGNLTLEPNGVLEMEIDNANNSDKILVTGKFAMQGGVVKPVPTETILGAHRYTVIEANEVDWPIITVIFSHETAFLWYWFHPGFPEEPNSIFVDVRQVPFDNPNIARTGNQRSLGAALQEIAEAGGNAITTDLQNLPTADDARAAYNQLSGQTRAPLAPVSVGGTSLFMGTVENRLRGLPLGGGPVGYDTSLPGMGTGMEEAALYTSGGPGYMFALGHGTPYLSDRPWAVWGRGYGVFGDREAESGFPGFDYTIYGGAFGLDYQFTERFLAGVTGGYFRGDVDFSSSRDNTDLTGTLVGLYGRYESRPWYLDSVLTYANVEYETRRFVDLLGERLEGDFDGYDLSAYFEAGFDLYCSARWLLQPLASFQLSYLDLEGYTETGGASALTFEDQDFESYKGSLGIRAQRKLFDNDETAGTVAEFRARWLHEFGDRQSTVDAHFATNPAAVFTVSDNGVARDSALLGAGLDARLSPGTCLQLDYDVLLNPDKTDHVVSAAFEYRW